MMCYIVIYVIKRGYLSLASLDAATRGFVSRLVTAPYRDTLAALVLAMNERAERGATAWRTAVPACDGNPEILCRKVWSPRDFDGA